MTIDQNEYKSFREAYSEAIRGILAGDATKANNALGVAFRGTTPPLESDPQALAIWNEFHPKNETSTPAGNYIAAKDAQDLLFADDVRRGGSTNYGKPWVSDDVLKMIKRHGADLGILPAQPRLVA